MTEEVELKLELTPGPRTLLEAASLFGGDGDDARQRSLYFDTPDRTLFAHGFSLRIRRTGRKRVQTIKARNGTSAGLFARSEWERPVSNDTPVIDETTPLHSLLGAASATLVPLFEVRIDRRTWLIREAGSQIEAVFDIGAARIGDRQTPICEVELELKNGGASCLFDLARKLDAIVPVRLGILSKAERGYRLLGPAAVLFKAEPVVLDAELTAAQAFQAIVQNCLRQFRQNEDILFQRRDADALHQARVALRRLRSAFTIFQAMLPDQSSDALAQKLRSIAATLGTARNLDVLIARTAPGSSLRDRIEEGRDGAYREVEERLASPEMRGFMIDLAQWLAQGAWLTASETQALRDQRAETFAAEALSRRMKRLKKRGDNLDHAPDLLLHALRKDAKKLRYASEFFASYFQGKKQKRHHARFVRALEMLQDQLGLLIDLATAPQVLADLGLADDPGAAVLRGSGRRDRLIAKAGRAYEKLIDAKRFWAWAEPGQTRSAQRILEKHSN